MKDRFINLAIQQALQSNMPNRLGAVVVHKKTVLGAGYNRFDHPLLYKSSGVPALHSNMGMHAEVSALHCLDYKQTKGSIVYVVRLRKNQTLALSKPCVSCQEYLNNVGIKRVIYSIDDGSFEIMRVPGQLDARGTV